MRGKSDIPWEVEMLPKNSPKFFTPEIIPKILKSPRFGLSHYYLLYSITEKSVFCRLSPPNYLQNSHSLSREINTLKVETKVTLPSFT